MKVQDKYYDLTGKVFEGDEKKYSKNVSGKFDYIDSSGSQTWDIQMVIPIRLRVSAKDRLCIRMIFLKSKKKLIKKSGRTGSCYIGGVILNELNVKLLTEQNKETCWNGRATRNWSLPDTVYLNPDKISGQEESSC